MTDATFALMEPALDRTYAAMEASPLQFGYHVRCHHNGSCAIMGIVKFDHEPEQGEEIEFAGLRWKVIEIDTHMGFLELER